MYLCINSDVVCCSSNEFVSSVSVSLYSITHVNVVNAHVCTYVMYRLHAHVQWSSSTFVPFVMMKLACIM